MKKEMLQFIAFALTVLFTAGLYAQVPVPGPLPPGLLPPPGFPTTLQPGRPGSPGVGEVIDANGNPTQPIPRLGRRCDNMNYCRGLAQCVPAPLLPNGQQPPCPFQQTVSAILVGTCINKANHLCAEAPANASLVCMILEYRSPSTPPTTNDCQNSCGQWEYVRGGQCRQ